MGKIRCIILRKDRSRTTVKVNGDRGYFRFRNGIYNVDREAVNLSAYPQNPNPTPELIYMEEDPRPIGSETDRSKLLDEQIIENVLKSAGAPTGLALQVLADYLRDPDKLLKLMFILIVLIAVLVNVFGGVTL